MTDAAFVPPEDAAAPTSPSEPTAATPATSPVGIPRIGVAPAQVPVPRPTPTIRSHTLLVDSSPERLRRTEDLLDLFLSLLVAASMLVLATYGHRTTTGVTQDVQNAFAVVLRQVLVFPLQALEGLATFILPVAVLMDRILRRSWRSAGEAALSSVGGWLAAVGLIALLENWAPDTLLVGLAVSTSSATVVGISVTFAALAGLLSGAGEQRTIPTVRYGWAALWIILGLGVLRGALPLTGAILSVMVGRAVGLAMRWAWGVEDRRAAGVTLVRALRRAGLDAVRVVRMDHAPEARAWNVTTDAPLGYTEQVRESPLATLPDLEAGPGQVATPPAGPTGTPSEAADPPPRPVTPPTPNAITPADVDVALILDQARSSALTEARASVHRSYAVWDSSGVRRNVTVLDPDPQVAGFLVGLWDRLRVRGLSPTRDLSVRPAAEYAALMSMEASRAGVRTPRLEGMAEAAESMLLVTDYVEGARTFDALGADITEEVLDQLWNQVRGAHSAGLAHREISASSVVLDAAGLVWLLSWESGETVSSELSRRVDLAQTLALVASEVGVERAIASASRALTTEQIASIAPMLQKVVLPASTREALGRRAQVLQELRDALVALTPTAHAEPAKLTRFQPRTVLLAVVGLVAVWTMLARLNLEQITAAVAQANVWWILAALVFSLATYVGAGMTLVALSPASLGLWRSTEVHLASSVVALVAPAGVGGAAINLRFLNRRGVPTAMGIATVALVQVIQFLVTVVLLVVLAATTGQSTGLSVPSGGIVLAAVALVVVITASLLTPRIRTFVWSKVEPTYRQVWPRLVWVLSNPGRLALGVGGALLLSLSYVMAFAGSLWAFGYTLPFSVLAITYLAANTVGSVVPSPGGIGPVELALTAGLVTAGIPSGVALSAAVVYRLVTFWVPIPVGWLSLRRLQKVGDL